MSDAPSRRMDRASEMRLAFDRSFAELPRFDSTPEENFLAIRLGTEGYAVHLSEVAGLFVNKQITRVPSQVATLIGIAGFRGAIVPVYDLHLLLGYPRADRPAWLAVASGIPVALAFDAFDCHLRIPRDSIVPSTSEECSRKYVREFASVDGLIRPIVHLPSILDAIKNEMPKNKT